MIYEVETSRSQPQFHLGEVDFWRLNQLYRVMGVLAGAIRNQ
jgi:hypothetical protein